MWILEKAKSLYIYIDKASVCNVLRNINFLLKKLGIRMEKILLLE